MKLQAMILVFNMTVILMSQLTRSYSYGGNSDDICQMRCRVGRWHLQEVSFPLFSLSMLQTHG